VSTGCKPACQQCAKDDGQGKTAQPKDITGHTHTHKNISGNVCASWQLFAGLSQWQGSKMVCLSRLKLARLFTQRTTKRSETD